MFQIKLVISHNIYKPSNGLKWVKRLRLINCYTLWLQDGCQTNILRLVNNSGHSRDFESPIHTGLVLLVNTVTSGCAHTKFIVHGMSSSSIVHSVLCTYVHSLAELISAAYNNLTENAEHDV